MADFTASLDADVAIVGAGPSGMAAAYYLAKAGAKAVLFERGLRVGGGMPGGGMMFNKIVVQREAKDILDEFDINTTEYESGYYVADALEATSTMCSKAIKAGAKMFNLISVEDVMIREDNRITGLVLNWSAVTMAGLHVDPLTMRSKMAIDATGHDSELCHIIIKRLGARLNTKTGELMGEKSMWAEVAENEILGNTKEVFPGLIVAGMAANAVMGSPRMGPVFGGMLISGRRAAEIALGVLQKV